MRINKIYFIIFSVLAALSVSTNFALAADPWFVETMVNGQAVLSPGTTTYCQKDFTVENMSDTDAEVQVIMGNGDNYYNDPIGPNGKIAYSLKPDSPFATSNGKGTQIDEARIVNSTAGTSMLAVHCKQ